MIRVAKVAKPVDFDTKTKTPGTSWLRSNRNTNIRPKDLWSPHLRHLADGFAGRCGYAAMLDPTGGTIDHYLCCKNHRKLAYEWLNFRFASHVLNATKGTADNTVFDPYEVQPGWFEIILPSLQMIVTPKVPVKQRVKAENTLKRLKLGDGEKIIRWRRSYYEQYQKGNLSLDGLREVAPLIADAVKKDSVATKTISMKVPRPAR